MLEIIGAVLLTVVGLVVLLAWAEGRELTEPRCPECGCRYVAGCEGGEACFCRSCGFTAPWREFVKAERERKV